MDTVQSAPFTVRPLHPVLGAEVLGLDLAREPDNETFARIEDLFLEHKVLVFRDQKLTPDQHVRFSRSFGPLAHHVSKPYVLADNPYVYIVSNIIENGKPIGVADAGSKWHSDFCYLERPARASLLYALEVPVIDGVARGDTSFADTAAAYDALPDDLRSRLAHTRSVYRFTHQYDQRVKSGSKLAPLTDEQRKMVPDVFHPVFRTHPYTGRKCIFVNELHTTAIDGMADADSAATLARLYAHIAQPQFIYRHSWRTGDLVLWDNCSTQHIANSKDYALPYRRRMHRTTVRGQRTF